MEKERKKYFYDGFHTERFQFRDYFFVPTIICIFVLIFIAQPLGSLITGLLGLTMEGDGFIPTFTLYFFTIGTWIAFLAIILIFKYNRPILKALTPQAKGNNIKMALLGMLVGFAMNAGCIVMAWLHKDVYFSFNTFQPLLLLGMFAAVWIQSSSEELVTRGYLYQRLRRGYKSPAVAIGINAILFGLLHLLNPSVTLLSFLNLVVASILFSFAVYYFDSIWFAMFAHAAWNFTQNILFGLPNSGIVTSFSLLRLDATTGKSTIFYDPNFGIEGSLASVLVLIIVCAVIFVIGRKRKTRGIDVWEIAELEKKDTGE